jgi:hypothetical protein
LYFNLIKFFHISLKFKLLIKLKAWGLGIGDWGLGIGDWAQSPIPNPQSPNPNQKVRLINLNKKYLFYGIKLY